MTTISLRDTAIDVAADIVRTGGSTRSAVVGVLPPTSGYAVSLAGYEETLPFPGLPSQQRATATLAVLGFVSRHRATLALPGHYVGAWRDGDTLYLDVSQVVPERAVAARLAAERNQLAYFDLGTGTEHKVPPQERTA